MDGGELLGHAVAGDHPGRQGQEVGLGDGVLPSRRATFGHVDLVEEERDEGHLPVGPGIQAGEHVFVAVAGEGAAVVPGDGKSAGSHGT